MPDLETSNLLAAVGVVLLNIGALKLLLALVTNGWFSRTMKQKVQWLALPAAFLLTLAASVITLYYSEVLGAEPCSWCWFQRVFLYPQVILFAIAAWRRDTGVALYSIALSVFGAGIALYQHYLQMGGLDIVPCPATGSAADCATRTMFEFGYITYPFMAFSLFVFLILLMLVLRSSEQRSRTEGVA